MNELVAQNSNLPDKVDDLSRFVLIGNEKLNSVRAEIRAIDRLKLAQEVRAQKMEEASMLSEALLDAEVKLGELFKAIPTRQGGDRRSDDFKLRSGAEFENTNKTKTEIVENLGFSQDQANRFEILADNKDLVEIVKAEARENDELPTKTRILDLAAYQKKMEAKCDEYSDFIDLSVIVYKEFAKALDGINKFEVTPQRMDALRENFDAVMTVDNQIQFINIAIDKLNLIKSEIRKGKKYDKIQ